jgi:hypothetical protein
MDSEAQRAALCKRICNLWLWGVITYSAVRFLSPRFITPKISVSGGWLRQGLRKYKNIRPDRHVVLLGEREGRYEKLIQSITCF